MRGFNLSGSGPRSMKSDGGSFRFLLIDELVGNVVMKIIDF
jgi:hypothetical protein